MGQNFCLGNESFLGSGSTLPNLCNSLYNSFGDCCYQCASLCISTLKLVPQGVRPVTLFVNCGLQLFSVCIGSDRPIAGVAIAVVTSRPRR
jgi:hypothetical protein